MILQSIRLFPIELKMTRSFKQPVFSTSHKVFFVLEEVELIGDGWLEIVLGAFATDEAVDEVVFWDRSVD